MNAVFRVTKPFATARIFSVMLGRDPSIQGRGNAGPSGQARGRLCGLSTSHSAAAVQVGSLCLSQQHSVMRMPRRFRESIIWYISSPGRPASP